MLEGGCGLGTWILLLRKEGVNIIGIDFSHWTVEKLRQVMPGFPVEVGDVTKLPYNDASFDAYISLGVAEHFLEGPGYVLKEAHRVLKPGGLLFLAVPYMNPIRLLARPWDAIVENIQSKNANLDFYQYAYSSLEMKRILGSQGFTVLKVYPYNIYFFLTEFRFFRILFNFFYRMLKGKILSWGTNRLDMVVKTVNTSKEHNASGLRLRSAVEQVLKNLANNFLVSALFSHEILFIAKKA